jgi:hypothetical protein
MIVDCSASSSNALGCWLLNFDFPLKLGFAYRKVTRWTTIINYSLLIIN